MSVDRGAYRGAIPQITWGAAYANTLAFAQPLDDAVCYTVGRGEIGRTDGYDGGADGWTYGMRGILEGVVRRIPRVDTSGVTGWESATGWDAFLAAARDAQPFRFYPDVAGAPSTYWNCYLADDTDDASQGHDEEITRHRTIRLRIRQADQSVFDGY